MTIDTPTAAQVPQLWTLWREAFGDSEGFLNTFAATAFSAHRCRCAAESGRILAAVYWFDCLHMGRKVAYLYALATARDHRGRGIARRLMADTHAHLEKLGYAGALLVPGEKSLFAYYEAMDYRTCGSIREFVCASAADAVPLCQVDAGEYARLRRQLLPQGGVIQEQESLDFLATQAGFYAGQGFLLAARGEGDTLAGLELLGDPMTAPGIVHALGYARGSFRTPGEGRPFAMYRPLGDSGLPAPTYFGLAFD